MKLKLIALFAGLSLAGHISQASATIVDITYTGTLADSYDSGLFGPAGYLDGTSFTAHFTFDLSTTGTLYSISGPYANGLGGGSAFGPFNSPATAASITINGVTQSFGVPSADGRIYAYSDTNSQQEHYAYSSISPNNGMYATVASSTPAIPGTIDVPFTYTVQPGDSTDGYFQITDNVNSAQGAFRITSLSETVEGVSAVPEPSTWAMMVLGFAGIGLVTYRRRQSLSLSKA